jgi:transposase-like protein
MTEKVVRLFSREFKLAALARMEAGENVSALARELSVGVAGARASEQGGCVGDTVWRSAAAVGRGVDNSAAVAAGRADEG